VRVFLTTIHAAVTAEIVRRLALSEARQRNCEYQREARQKQTLMHSYSAPSIALLR
jgi:hypothetical protein